MEAVQWQLVYMYKHRDRSEHRPFHGNTDRPWKSHTVNDALLPDQVCHRC